MALPLDVIHRAALVEIDRILTEIAERSRPPETDQPTPPAEAEQDAATSPAA